MTEGLWVVCQTDSLYDDETETSETIIIKPMQMFNNKDEAILARTLYAQFSGWMYSYDVIHQDDIDRFKLECDIDSL